VKAITDTIEGLDHDKGAEQKHELLAPFLTCSQIQTLKEHHDFAWSVCQAADTFELCVIPSRPELPSMPLLSVTSRKPLGKEAGDGTLSTHNWIPI
jgi:hypothetical protein